MQSIKKSLYLIILLFIANSTFAQKSYKEMMDDVNYNFYEVVEAVEKYFEKNPKGKGSGYRPYIRWKEENEPKFYPSGDRICFNPNLITDSYKKQLSKNNSAQYKTANQNGWIDLGPYSIDSITNNYNTGIGRVEAIWVNPENDKQIFFGSKSGGFWKTNDGGATWKNTTDFLIATGVNSITVNPNNYKEVLISLRSSYYNRTYGIYRSLDGGDTWSESKFNPANIGFGGSVSHGNINKVKYHPYFQNLILISTSQGVFVSKDNLNSWTTSNLPNSTHINDIEFHPVNNNIIYAMYSFNSNYILRSIDQGLTFVETGELIDNSYKNGILSISQAAPNNVWFASEKGIWKSEDSGLTFDFVINPDERCEAFVVSDIDISKQIYGYVNIEASTNDITFSETTKWNNRNPDNSYVHADLRTAESVNGVFYVGTDGYLCKSMDNGQTWIRLNESGTCVRENYAFGVAQSNHQTLIGGSQDNGTSIYYKGQWIEYSGADGIEALVHPLNEDWMIGSMQRGIKLATKNGGQSFRGVSASSKGSQYFLDPNDQMKLFNFSDSVYVSKEFGKNYKLVGSPNFVSGNSKYTISEAAIAYNNSNLLVTSALDNISLSKDGGYSWTNIESNLPGLYISDLAFSPKNDSIIVVTYASYINDNQKVYITTNLGESWTNITYNLENIPIRTVAIDNTDENNIYLGGEIGVYTKPMNGNNWTLYTKNLSNVSIQEFDINYGTNEIFATTWGRGYWKTDLVGKSTYPKILTTDITDAPTDSLPMVGSNQIVTCTIDYATVLTNVEVRWSVNNLSFSNTINMSNVSGNTWVSNSALPCNYPGDKVYFKVFAKGNNNDVSETYKFMYEVRGECNSEILSQAGNDFEGENDKDLLGLNADVNADGNRIALASHRYDYEGGIDNGLVRVFDQINGNWVQVGNDIAGSYNQQLGTRVSISSNGKRLAVGYKFNLDYTKVFELKGKVWSQLGNTIYSNSGEVKLSGDGNTLITSEWSDDTFGNNFGIVNVFEFDGINWNAKGKVTRTKASSVGFGQAIDISSNGNRIAVRSYHNVSGVGIVNIYTWNKTNRSWYAYGNTLLGNEQSSQFGQSIAMNEDGNVVAISAAKGNSAVYKFNGNGNVWQEVGGLIDPSFFLTNWSKIDISGDGKTVLLSNPTETVNENSNFGAVARYQLENENWNKTGNTIYGNATNKYFGINAALSENGKLTLIGGYNNDYKGYAKIYKSTCKPLDPDFNLCGSDANTLLLLPFDNTLNGVDGETPLNSSSANFTTGKYNDALNMFPDSGEPILSYAVENNLNPHKGTLEAWLKPDWNGNDGEGYTILSYGGWGGMIILKDGANNLRLIMNVWSPSGYPEIDVAKNIADWQANEWKHVAFTWGDGKLQLYINGSLASEQTYTTPLAVINDTGFQIGVHGDIDWEGDIDHLRISSTIRSQNEITDFMNGCVTTKIAHQPPIEIYNFPNPFAGQTTISYTLPEESLVTLTVYNGMGKQVALLHEYEVKQSGTHSINFDGSKYPPGIYYYTFQTVDEIETQKMILIK